jgi:hypothetical protein
MGSAHGRVACALLSGSGAMMARPNLRNVCDGCRQPLDQRLRGHADQSCTNTSGGNSLSGPSLTGSSRPWGARSFASLLSYPRVRFT